MIRGASPQHQTENGGRLPVPAVRSRIRQLMGMMRAMTMEVLLLPAAG
jgi:hypothetical protein